MSTTTAATASPITSPYVLPALPYGVGDLEPVISAEIMELHHGKHHHAYVEKANELNDELIALHPGDDPSSLLKALAFNVSGHVLHSLFWENMSPRPGASSDALNHHIQRCFGSHEALVDRMTTAVAKLSGSGWAVLSWEPWAQKLSVAQLHDHHGDVMVGAVPLLVIDGWEHAYYLQYRADRAAWAKRFFEVADWGTVSARFDAAQG